MMDEKKYAELESKISPKPPLATKCIYCIYYRWNNLFNRTSYLTLLYDLF